MAFGLSAAAIGGIGAIGGAAIGAYGANKAAKTQAQAIADANKQDPRIEQMLYGSGSNGLLDRFYRQMDQGRSGASNQFASDSGNYLSNYGGADMSAARDAAYKAMSGNAAPQAQAAGAGLNAYASGNMVQAPGQNNIDLTGSYDRFINGKPGENQFLDQSINGAIAQNRLGFNQLQDDATKNLMERVMPSIRSNSVLSGQYGGSRQGIAEGNAIGTLGTEMARAASQFGQNATNAAVNAKAGAYETDSNRALAATQGLGAQQYGVASQNAQTKNQAEFMNVGNNYDLGKFNAGMAQQTNLANQGAQLSTNAQNNGSLLAGGGLLSGLTNQAAGTVAASDNYDLNRMQQVNGLLAPYLSRNPSGQVAPAANTGAAALGGGLAGLSLGNSLSSMFNNSTPTSFAGPGPFAGPSAGPGIMGAFPAGGY